MQHDHAEVVGDDVVQFPGDPGPLSRRSLLGLPLQRRAPRGHRYGLPAAADQNANQPECQKLQRLQSRGHLPDLGEKASASASTP